VFFCELNNGIGSLIVNVRIPSSEDGRTTSEFFGNVFNTAEIEKKGMRWRSKNTISAVWILKG